MQQSVTQAMELQREGALAEASRAWAMASGQADHLARCATAPADRRRWGRVATGYRERSRQAPANQQGNNESEASGAERFRFRSAVNFDEIAGLEATRRELLAGFAMWIAQPPQGVVLPRPRSLLLYGPPGCGKTLLAAAISHSLDIPFYTAKASDLLSKYYGESSQSIAALYREARSTGPSVVFLDEIDAMAGSRDESDSTADRRVVVSLLTEIDGIADKTAADANQRAAGVLTIAATNAPWRLDTAILSRFQKAIYVPLPDPAARGELLRRHLTRLGYTAAFPASEFVKRTAGLSGRGVRDCVSRAIELMVEQQNPDLIGLLGRGRRSIEAYRVQVGAVTEQHLRQARGEIRPACDAAAIDRFRQWRNRGS
ncbi:MAG: ATP-binding protein [Planctomycetota bacterium]